MNQYEKAIFEVCNVMMPYTNNGQFKTYGFGGIPVYMGQTKTSRLWNLNGTQSPECYNTLGVLKAYQKAILGTKLAGPTYFSQLLKKVKKEAQMNIIKQGLHGNRTYSVVIIVTDGNCHDFESTKSLLIELSGLPFSAVVVGVGQSDFSDMEILDADEEVLTDNSNRYAKRDILQLVKYSDFKDLGMRELALAVLDEIPDQFIDYMILKETEPQNIYQPTPL